MVARKGTESDLNGRPNGDPEKVKLAVQLRPETTTCYTDIAVKQDELMNDKYYNTRNRSGNLDVTILGLTPLQIISKTSSVAIGDAPTVRYFSVCFGTNGGSYGIVFSNSLTMPAGDYNESNTNYSTEWVQVLEPISTKTLAFLKGTTYGNFMKQATNVMLDTGYPYGFDPTLPYPDTSDSPFDRLDLSTNQIGGSMSLKFEMWLMFQPTNGQWVPLREVSWNCAGAATNNGSGWLPLASPSWSTNPPDTDAGVRYPTWTNTFYNLHFQRHL